jgi:hypothetical protein
LVAAASEPGARPLFYRLLAESALFFLDASSDSPLPEGSTLLRTGASVKAVCVEIGGTPHTAIFSSLSVLRTCIRAEHRYVSILGRDLFELMRGTHLVLNPGAAYGKQILPNEIEAILNGSAARGYTSKVIEKATQVMLGQPAEYPQHLTEALAARFRSDKQVRAAYLALCSWPESGEQFLMIGLDAEGNWEALMRAVTATLREVAKPNETVDFVRMDQSSFADYLRSTRPFYKRKRFGLF